jgi:hypothetical protein
LDVEDRGHLFKITVFGWAPTLPLGLRYNVSAILE